MNKLCFLVAALSTLITAPTWAQSNVDECYKTAATTIALRECLKQELQETRTEYRDVLTRLTQHAAELDRITGRNEAVPALERANTAFDRYVAEQCRFDQALFSSGTGAGAANLSCQINLLHARIGAIESQLPQ